MEQDEKMIESMNLYKKGTSGNIEDGFCIKEKMYYFKKEEFFQSHIQVMLPEVFVDLPEDIRRMKYPNEQRPPIIKSNLEEGMDFTFNILDYPKEFRTIDKVSQFMKNVLKTMNPAFQFYEEKVERLGDMEMAWFDFKSFGLDGNMYNIYYFIHLCTILSTSGFFSSDMMPSMVSSFSSPD